MDKLINSIGKSLENNNWYAALILALVIPDICGKLEDTSKNSNKRYVEWFNQYLGGKYANFLSGSDCYALRCSFLHEGSDITEKQRAREVLDRFVFTANGSHCNKVTNSFLGDPRFDGKSFLQLSVFNFCTDMIEAGRKWLADVSSEKHIQSNISKMLQIHEGGVTIGGLRIE